MEIKLNEITVREVFNGYQDNAINGVVGYGGKLNIRPAYQREFVYGQKECDVVLDTVIKGFPLNVMYWCDDGNGNYELLDGQQRTISLCQYCNGDFSLNNRLYSLFGAYAFHNVGISPLGCNGSYRACEGTNLTEHAV